MFLENGESLGDEEIENECASQVEIKTFASWQIDDNSAEVIYICPRETQTSETTTNTDVQELIERIEHLETGLQLVDLGGKNWILFDVKADTSKTVSWS